MKKLLILILTAFTSIIANAQANYFVYVQTENKQPFYVKMNKQVLNSSASGYMVIPKLTSGNYILTAGFAKDEWPEQNIPFTVGNTDVGYLLKNYGEKGWGLYNIQTTEISMNGEGVSKKTTVSSDEVFSNALAGVANTTLSVPPQPLDKPVEKVPGTDVKLAEPKMKSSVEKIGMNNTAAGTYITYLDRTGNKTDTVKIFIAAEPAENSQVPINNNKGTVTDPVVAVPETKTINPPPTEVPAPKTDEFPMSPPLMAPPPPLVKEVPSEPNPASAVAAQCRAVADVTDFLKLRKKMAAEKNDENMLNVARKMFRSKCFTTEQIKNLSLLFLKDDGKYYFFDAAYGRTADAQNFPSLQFQLSDTYFINRFKALIRN